MVDYSFDRQIELEQLQNLLRQTGWANQRSIEGVQKMLEGTPLTLGAWEGDSLVGFARVITDGDLSGINRRCGCGGVETWNRHRFRIDAAGSRSVS